MIISGKQEEDSENLTLWFRSLTTDKMCIKGDGCIDHIYRLGRNSPNSGNSRPRPIMVKFALLGDKQMVWNERRTLKGTDIYLDQDWSPDVRHKRKLMFPVFREMQRQPGYQVQMMGENYK